MYCHYHLPASAMKMEAVSLRNIAIYLHYSPDDQHQHLHRREDLKSHKNVIQYDYYVIVYYLTC
jgi:hypothetical protein